MRIATSPFYGHKQAWLTTAERRVFNFRVTASTQVEIALSTYIGTSEVTTYIIRISNSESLEKRSGIWRIGKESEGIFFI